MVIFHICITLFLIIHILFLKTLYYVLSIVRIICIPLFLVIYITQYH